MGKIHYKSPFSIAMLVYQRVNHFDRSMLIPKAPMKCLPSPMVLWITWPMFANDIQFISHEISHCNPSHIPWNIPWNIPLYPMKYPRCSMVLEYLQYLPTNLCHCGVNVGHDIPIGKIHMNSPDVRSRQIWSQAHRWVRWGSSSRRTPTSGPTRWPRWQRKGELDFLLGHDLWSLMMDWIVWISWRYIYIYTCWHAPVNWG